MTPYKIHYTAFCGSAQGPQVIESMARPERF